MHSVSLKIFPPKIIDIYKFIVPGIIFGIGLMYLSSCIFHIKKNRGNITFLFFLFAGLLILFTTIKSAAQFSSRYVVQAAPLFLLAYSDYIRFNYKTLLIQIIGIILGICILFGYYHFPYKTV